MTSGSCVNVKEITTVEQARPFANRAHMRHMNQVQAPVTLK